jgi:predicted nucleic acid-binding protein
VTFLLDTCVISELAKSRPEPKVVTWGEKQAPESLFISVLTLGEIRKGIARLADRTRVKKLSDWLEHELPTYFHGRILPIDSQVADRWGRLLADAGRPLPVVDSLLAATALTHKMRLVTRNTRDFEHGGLKLVNPW